MNINLAPTEDLPQSACSLLTVWAGGEKSNFGLQSWFSSRCWQFLRRTSYDYFTSKSNGNLSKIPSLEVTIENDSTPYRFWFWNQSVCLEELSTFKPLDLSRNWTSCLSRERVPHHQKNAKEGEIGWLARFSDFQRGSDMAERLGRGGGLDIGSPFRSIHRWLSILLENQPVEW